uniref:Transmembrane protein n=1 Tax=Noccaea caerulescens TaxID=107243 RepID=A0A1J3FP86_NOCCA
MTNSGHEIGIRCHHCAGPLTKNLETSQWTVAPFIRDSFSMIGSAVGGTASAFIGFNHVMPIVRKWIKGPMWLHFLVGAPPVIVLSSACAGLAGGTVPALAQLASSSYRAAIHSSQPPQAQENNKVHESTTSPL